MIILEALNVFRYEYFETYFIYHYNENNMSYISTDQVIPRYQTFDVLNMSPGRAILPIIIHTSPPNF